MNGTGSTPNDGLARQAPVTRPASGNAPVRALLSTTAGQRGALLHVVQSQGREAAAGVT
jgi:hypothetical protein